MAAAAGWAMKNQKQAQITQEIKAYLKTISPPNAPEILAEVRTHTAGTAWSPAALENVKAWALLFLLPTATGHASRAQKLLAERYCLMIRRDAGNAATCALLKAWGIPEGAIGWCGLICRRQGCLRTGRCPKGLLGASCYDDHDYYYDYDGSVNAREYLGPERSRQDGDG